ncbi:hypothetical protein COCSUDRAFT_41552 [Coccomyxa subellipsoidea C-169]|uniref:Uncharacterized protein n=1 Tax=Coccomyxa subellipsoidea (strain C-169) TaxID=574566 RepID=I0Z0Y5_COCSC|nr:hypothetical protein COCSUDRAFT_41552 [Coccomyxa subellipsoidea C-169]EIE24304.1 hypothetical protein COCSUDRAFT_41552 [Coccomyxa subellipsoidea C-169]|eukprot:XP_005648848.1 hypothetical protein COCSUDRAFT_41552 [Coccomyxa subellipsoidea C-169]
MGDHGDGNLPASSPTSIIKHLETRAAYEKLSILDKGLLINYLQHKSGARVTAVLTEPIWKLVGRVEEMSALKDPEWTHVGVITADIRRDWFFFDTRMSLERLDIFLEFYPARPAPRLGRINMAELELLMYPAGHRTFPRTAVYSKSDALPCTAAYTEKGLHLASSQSLLAVSAGV